MKTFCLLFLFIPYLSLCSEKSIEKYMGSLNKHCKRQNVYFARTEDQHNTSTNASEKYRDAYLKDHTCLHRVFLSGYYLVDGLTDDSKVEEIETNLLKKMNEPFLDILTFDSFVNPHLFSVLCDDVDRSTHKDKDIASKLVYFNTDIRYAPVAGIYATSYVKTETFELIQEHIKQNISIFEPISSDSLYMNNYKEEESLNPSLCFNAEYKKLLYHVEQMQNKDDYTFGFISTKYGGEDGHGMLIIAYKKNKQLNFICVDGCNIALKYEPSWFDISQKRLERMIENPSFLKDAIVRYVCLTKPCAVANTEITDLNLHDYKLYVDYYKDNTPNRFLAIKQFFAMRNIVFMMLFFMSVYVSQDILY